MKLSWPPWRLKWQNQIINAYIFVPVFKNYIFSKYFLVLSVSEGLLSFPSFHFMYIIWQDAGIRAPNCCDRSQVCYQWATHILPMSYTHPFELHKSLDELHKSLDELHTFLWATYIPMSYTHPYELHISLWTSHTPMSYTHPYKIHTSLWATHIPLKWNEMKTTLKTKTKIMQRYAIEDNALYLKGQSNEIFDLQFFFHNSNLPGSLTNGVK